MRSIYRTILVSSSQLPVASNHGGFFITEKKDGRLNFTLLNYPALKIEASKQKAGEYITALSELSGKEENRLINIINSHDNEIKLAHVLSKIK